MLLIEDSEDDIALIRRTLRQAEIEIEHAVVVSADGLTDALDREDWHIILADYALPGFDAPEALRIVRARGADIPFILVSGTVGEDVAAEIMRAGAADYIMKSNLHRLAPAIAREVHAVGVRRAEARDRELLEAQLIQSQKLEAVGTLAGGVAHDFNNLLVVIRGNAELLALTPTDTAPGLYVDEVLGAVLRAEKLVQQLLAFSRRQALEKNEVQLNDLVTDVGAMLSHLIGEQINVRIENASDLPLIWGNRSQLEQVIMNLATNARDAMPDGGELTIQTASRTVTAASAIPRGDARPGGYVTLSISDTGTGIAPDVVAAIFDPFFTTKPPGQGTGLGLSTVYGIAKDHGGWVSVDSVVGRGTRFTIYLPELEETHHRASPRIADVLVRSPRPSRILVVEDDSAVRLLTVTALSQQGHSVTGVDSCADARLAVTRARTRFDLVVCDVGLPDGSGVNLTTALLRQDAHLRALVASGYSGEVDAADLDPSRTRFLAKPFGLGDLLNRVAQLLEPSPEG